MAIHPFPPSLSPGVICHVQQSHISLTRSLASLPKSTQISKRTVPPSSRQKSSTTMTLSSPDSSGITLEATQLSWSAHFVLQCERAIVHFARASGWLHLGSALHGISRLWQVTLDLAAFSLQYAWIVLSVVALCWSRDPLRDLYHSYKVSTYRIRRCRHAAHLFVSQTAQACATGQEAAGSTSTFRRNCPSADFRLRHLHTNLESP